MRQSSGGAHVYDTDERRVPSRVRVTHACRETSWYFENIWAKYTWQVYGGVCGLRKLFLAAPL